GLIAINCLNYSGNSSPFLGILAFSSGNSPGAATFTLGGSVSGLTGTLIIKNESNESLTITGSTYKFTKKYKANESYSVSVTSGPTGYYCRFSATSGTFGSSDITDNSISCIAGNFYGPVVGGTIIKQLNLSFNVSTIAGLAGSCGFLTNGTGNAARFMGPRDLATDGIYMYITDQASHTIQKMDLSTYTTTTMAGTATSIGFDATHLNSPFALTTDGTNIYVSDTVNHSIRKISIATQVMTTIGGQGPVSSGTNDGSSAVSRFWAPRGIVYLNNAVYIADNLNQTIRKIDLSTNTASTVAGTAGTSVPAGQDGIGSNARFNGPSGLVTDGTYVYISETANCLIRKMDPSNFNVLTIGGIAGTCATLDGTGTTATFNSPFGMTTDGYKLYIADHGSEVIREMILTTGSVTTVAGMLNTNTPAGQDGQGTTARFSHPIGGASNGVSIFIADYLNCTIRKID
ncbi:MAG: hypothetical protein K8R21_03590, partial [Leptospira sp.]|nr:hypothetical protein [Leptospira sp.]